MAFGLPVVGPEQGTPLLHGLGAIGGTPGAPGIPQPPVESVPPTIPGHFPGQYGVDGRPIPIPVPGRPVDVPPTHFPIPPHPFHPGGGGIGGVGGPHIPIPGQPIDATIPSNLHPHSASSNIQPQFPDHRHAQGIADHLQNVLSAVRDPELKQSLSNALATILKHISGIRKEQQQALAGKLSPRLLEQAYGMSNPGGPMQSGPTHAAPVHVPQIGNGQYLPARELALTGHPQEAAQQWIARHPYAVGHGHIPAFVSQWMQEAASPQSQAAFTNAPAGTPQAL